MAIIYFVPNVTIETTRMLLQSWRKKSISPLLPPPHLRMRDNRPCLTSRIHCFMKISRIYQRFMYIKDNDCVVNKYCGCFIVNLFSQMFMCACYFFYSKLKPPHFCRLRSYAWNGWRNLYFEFKPILFAFMRFVVITCVSCGGSTYDGEFPLSFAMEVDRLFVLAAAVSFFYMFHWICESTIHRINVIELERNAYCA